MNRLHPLLLLLLFLAHTTQAGLNITSAEKKIEGWIADNQSRSTTDIFFSCLFTLFVCTWTALHLNLPHPHDGEIRTLIRRAKWMFITFIGPEFVFGHAWAELSAAWKSRGYMKQLAAEHKAGWTLTHGFFANQGGFVLRFEEDNNTKEGVDAGTTPTIERGKALLETKVIQKLVGSQAESPPVNAKQIHYLVQRGLVQFPVVSKEEINDKSKSDIFAKGIACWQVLWLLIQCCAREVRHLPTTPLEISTLAFSACTLCTFGMWFAKPVDVKYPISLPVKPLPQDCITELRALSTKSIVADFFLVDQLGRGHSPAFQSRIYNDSYFVDRHYIVRFPRDIFVIVDWELGVMLLSMLFGGLHLIAWNFSFPTSIEQLLWRIASGITAGIMPLFYFLGTVVCLVALKVAPEWTFKHKDQIFSVPIGGASLAYGIARLYLLGESFASLRSLPPGTFQNTWTANLPVIH